MSMKTLTAGVLAATLSLTTVAPTTATADLSRDDAIVGIATLLLFGAAIHNSRNNDPAPVRTNPRPHPHNDAWRVLPANCLTHATRRNGDQVRFFGQRCLNQNYRAVSRLPQACRVAFRSRAGDNRAGYTPQCLQNHGFRSNRH
ncbi:hypothetical protein N9O61_02895 [Octadecabacter sp.]|nr:hypothetical protein [Octadecabacter sp.]